MWSIRKTALAAGLALAIGAGLVSTMVRNTEATPKHHWRVPPKLRILFIARRHLRVADRVLHRGKPIYGGHRVAAMKLIGRAEMQLKEAAKFVRHHKTPAAH